jgi:hypothetical protein
MNLTLLVTVGWSWLCGDAPAGVNSPRGVR